LTKHVILFLAASPRGLDRLALDREARAIHHALERAGQRDRFELVTRWAAQPLDLLAELRKLRPTVVHFSGHGSGGEPRSEGRSCRDAVVDLDGAAIATRSGLFFEGPHGQPQLVSTTALKDTFGAAGSSVRLVVLNACYSDDQAEALRAHVDCVVGVRGSISDDSARTFAIGFYGGLGEQESVAAAYQQGRAAISLETLPDADHPQLNTRDGVDAHRLVLAAAPSGHSGQGRSDQAGLAIVAMTARPSCDFPIIDFTIRNNATRSQILTNIHIDVLKYYPVMSAPLTRALLPLATWDVLVPRQVGATSLPAPTPVLIASDDAAVISVRLFCSRGTARFAPRDMGFYTLELAFQSDTGSKAISEPMSF
jgi:hypothetical protein